MTSAAPSRRQSGGATAALDTLDTGERLGDGVGIPSAHECFEGGERPGAYPGVLEALERGACGARLGQRLRAGIAELDREGGAGEDDENGHGGAGGDPAMADDGPGPGGPGAAGAIFPAAPWPVEPRPDRGQDDRQEGGRDRDADQRDQQPGDPEAAEKRNGESEEYEERDRHRGAAEDDGRAGVRHRVPDGDLVADSSLPMLLAPAHHDEERVVDRDPEPEQRDDELRGDRDVGDLGERPDQQERGRDGDRRHEQGHDRHERREDEREDDERAGARHQDLHENADARAGLLARGLGTKRLEARHAHRRPAHGGPLERRLGLPGLLLARFDPTPRPDVDERERGTTVLGDEGTIPGRGIGGEPRARQCGLHSREGGVELLGDTGRVHRRPLGQRHDRDDRRDVASAPVDRRDLAVRLEGLPPRHGVELLRECVSRAPDRGEGRDRDEDPEADDQSLVGQNPFGQGRHPSPSDRPRRTPYAYNVSVRRKLHVRRKPCQR